MKRASMDDIRAVIADEENVYVLADTQRNMDYIKRGFPGDRRFLRALNPHNAESLEGLPQGFHYATHGLLNLPWENVVDLVEMLLVREANFLGEI